MIKYPTRCKIIDVTGQEWHGFTANTPEQSKPHIGKEGIARRSCHGVTITLDDGSIIHGYDCWWEPLND